MIHKFNSEKASPALKRAAQMPALFHSLPDQEFAVANSEVVRWLIAQPEILNALFGYYKDKGAIVFANGRWHGAENTKTCRTP
jgi:hypothetical protein